MTAPAADAVAVIGFALRLPGAADGATLWRNLAGGVESILRLSEEDLDRAGIDPRLRRDPRFVRAGTEVEGYDLFDADFFSYSPSEAASIDPQHRLFLECAWEALEAAGHGGGDFPGAVGVYAGAAGNDYARLHLFPRSEVLAAAGRQGVALGTERDYLATRVSYKLGLKGPSVNVHCACSSSLVAVHLAAESLLNGECDLALAGGVSLRLPQRAGYLWEEGGVTSPDGHCRAFDAAAQGTVFGSGAAVVVLRRLADALADGDPVAAVLRGSAVNNDGAARVGFTAPGVEGQAAVIAAALAVAGVEPESIGYVEAHGTGTALGDPVEVEALTQAFGGRGRHRCALGSLKPNVGHLETVSGVAGLIKVVLALGQRQIPPTLHFRAPNPRIDFAATPFYVNDRLAPWPADGGPRRAGVSSFGMGGTNAHVIVEEAPEPAATSAGRPHQLLVLSARSPGALDEAAARLRRFLDEGDQVDLADVAWTLQAGRRAFEHRRVAVAAGAAEAAGALAPSRWRRNLTGRAAAPPPVAFLFPGQGAQHPGMARELYRHEPSFRAHVDRCSELLAPWLEVDLAGLLDPLPGAVARAEEALARTAVAQPALFAVEVGVARLWMDWGVRPAALLGHSLGEYAAAHLAGVFTLAEGLELMTARGRLMEELPAGAMLAVALPARRLAEFLTGGLELAADNGRQRAVAAGPAAEVAALARRLATLGVARRRLPVERAFHSAMMAPARGPLRRLLEGIELRPPAIPFVSNLTGTWIRPAEATDPDYWCRQMTSPVRFAAGLEELLGVGRLTLEVGPGRALSALAGGRGRRPLASLGAAGEGRSSLAVMLEALGRLWIAGVEPDWRALHGGERRRRLPLPTYPFQRRRAWVPPVGRGDDSLPRRPPGAGDAAPRLHLPYWRPAPPPERAGRGADGGGERWLLFLDEGGLGAALARRLEAAGRRCATVVAGAGFSRLGAAGYTVSPRRSADYRALLAALGEAGAPLRVVHLWSVTSPEAAAAAILERGYGSLLALAGALRRAGRTATLEVVSNGMQAVAGEAPRWPEKAAVLGLCRSLARCLPGLRWRSIDLPAAPAPDAEAAGLLAAELAGVPRGPGVAFRGGKRWELAFTALPPEAAAGDTPPWRPGGAYLVIAAAGGPGPALAGEIGRRSGGSVALLVPPSFPAPRAWPGLLATAPPDDPLRRVLEELGSLERAGRAPVLVCGDLTSAAGAARALAEVRRRVGEVCGVVDASTGAGTGASRGLGAGGPRLAARVAAARHLVAALGEVPLDFLVFCTAAAADGAPLAASAAGAFLDSLAHQLAGRRAGATVAVGWEPWWAAPAGGGIPPAAGPGLEVLTRVLGLGGWSQVVVTAGDPAAAWAGAAAGEAERPPATSAAGPSATGHRGVEERLARIWEQVLGLDGVGAGDSFVELGGDSVLALEVASRARSAGLELSPEALLLYPTLGELAAALDGGAVAAPRLLAEDGVPPEAVFDPDPAALARLAEKRGASR